MKTRILHTKVWQDELVSELSPIQKLLFIYYITNDNIGLTGIYEITDRQVSFDTGLSKTQIAEAKTLFEKSGKLFFYKNWVYVINAQRLNGFHGEKLNTAIKKEKALIPVDISSYFDRVSKNVDRVSDFDDTPINHKSEIINHKEEVVKEKQENSIGYLKLLPEAHVKEFADKYNCDQPQVRQLATQLVFWCETNGKTKKNYSSFLQNRLLDKYGFRKKITAFKPSEIAPEISEEQRQRNIARIAEMKVRMKGVPS